MKGYWGKLLRINLNSHTFSWEEIPEDTQWKYIGGKGFGRKYMYDEIDPAIDALGPLNKLFFFVGPGAGTYLPTTTRFSLHTLSPLTGVSIDSYCGGSFGTFMKKTGIDGIVVEGISPTPVALYITENDVIFKDATHLWGKDCYESEIAIKKDWGKKQARVLTIGPAGENLVKIASIGHDLHRHLGRGGSGAVMGSKKLKAIAIYGEEKVEVAHQKELKIYCQSLISRIKEHPGTGHVYPLMGTTGGVDLTNMLGVFPSHYWADGSVEHSENINFSAIQENTLVKATQCLGCPIRCAHINRVNDGVYEGVTIDGPEYETIYAFGGLCKIKDIREIIKINDVCDRLGMDTISAGNLIGFMMYATEKEVVSKKDSIQFGDIEATIRMLQNIAYRKGLGDTLAEGIRSIGKYYSMEDEVIEVKGLEPAGYDPRGLKGMALTYAVSTRGATHLSSTVYAREFSGEARNFELRQEAQQIDRFSIDNRAELVYNIMNFNTIADCFIFCRFLNRDLLTWEDYTTIYDLLTDVYLDKNELMKTANRITTLSKLFNIKAGLSRKDDRLPKRFLSESLRKGASSDSLVGSEELNRMIDEYYALRGWDKEGNPTPKTQKWLDI